MVTQRTKKQSSIKLHVARARLQSDKTDTVDNRETGQDDESMNDKSTRLREIHDSSHVRVQWFKATFECFERRRRLSIVHLSRGVREVDVALRIVVILGTRADNVRV